MSTITPTFSGEMQLAAWSESHTGGCKVTFWLPTPQDLDAFRALTVRKGNHAGHRFMAVLVEVGDDEQPVQQPELEKAKGGALAQWAAMRCTEEVFREFLWDANSMDVVPTEQEAVELIYLMCHITSRAELDNSAEAKRLFDERIRKPYAEWQRKRGAA